MADIPDIIIRSAEERRAEENAEKHLLTEIPGDYGTHLIADQITRSNATQIWAFPDLYAAMAWAALRARELAREGVDFYAPYPLDEIDRNLPDSRTRKASSNFREDALEEMLKW